MMATAINRLDTDKVPHGIVIRPEPVETMQLYYLNDAILEALDRERAGQKWEMALYAIVLRDGDLTPKTYLYGRPPEVINDQHIPRYRRLLIGSEQWETSSLEEIAYYLNREHPTWCTRRCWGFLPRPIRNRKGERE